MKLVNIVLMLFISWTTFSQIEGFVYEELDGEKKPIPNVDVYFKNSKKGDYTCGQGAFLIDIVSQLPDTLIVRATGYYSDTIPISKKEKTLYLKIKLTPDHVLEEVVIRQKRANSSILRLDPRNTEVLNSGELRKAACCNLSESFETNATVDVNIPDGVSGAKRIAMMGLDGTYTQIQLENIPILQNLDQPYGLMAIPGTWINSIQITKGTGTVVNGYESMAGLINLEYHQPDDMEKLFLNIYGNIRGRGELNMHVSKKLTNKWSTALFGQVSTNQLEVDRNNDNFRDIQIGHSGVLLNRWKYKGEQFIQQFGINGSYSNKTGGQLGYQKGMENNLNPVYGVSVVNAHLDFFGKSGWMIKDKPYRSFALIYYGEFHDLDVAFGKRYLKADEKRGYLNFMYEDIVGSTAHVIKAGASFVVDDLNQIQINNLSSESVVSTLYRTELVPGIYTEYTYTGMRTTLVAGMRNDYHNLVGNQFSPRANLKYKITENMDLRGTAGRGFRVPNYMVDKLSLMSTNLPWVVEDNLAAEVSWNMGGSWFYTFNLFKEKAVVNLDYYHTFFTNQLIADRDVDPTFIEFKNLEGESFSNVVQFDFKFEPAKNLEVKLAYKFSDVRATMGGELMEKLMVPRHRGFFNTAYTTRNNRWKLDATLSVFGQQRLARVVLPDATLSQDNWGGIVPLLHGQVTHVYKKWEFYVGGENLLDKRLQNPIIDTENPFGDHFDATRVWAPIIGINIYAGVRFAL